MYIKEEKIIDIVEDMNYHNICVLDILFKRSILLLICACSSIGRMSDSDSEGLRVRVPSGTPLPRKSCKFCGTFLF